MTTDRVAKSILMRAFGRPRGVLGRLGGIVMAHMNRRLAERAIEMLDVQPSDTVLEVGFGPGVGIHLLSERALSGRVAGVDPSPEMLAQARARNATAVAAGRVDLRQGSAEGLPFENAAFDKALAINSMQVWPDAVAGLREIWRTLRPGGRVVLGFTPWSGQSKGGLTESLAAAGFADPRVMAVDSGVCALAVKPTESTP